MGSRKKSKKTSELASATSLAPFAPVVKAGGGVNAESYSLWKCSCIGTLLKLKLTVLIKSTILKLQYVGRYWNKNWRSMKMLEYIEKKQLSEVFGPICKRVGLRIKALGRLESELHRPCWHPALIIRPCFFHIHLQSISWDFWTQIGQRLQ